MNISIENKLYTGQETSLVLVNSINNTRNAREDLRENELLSTSFGQSRDI